MDNRFIKKDFGKFHIIYTTKEDGFCLSINGDDFKKNMNMIKDKFNLKDIVYNYQTHSSIVNIKDEKNYREIIEGDSLIISKEKVAAGVFTADCVPIIIFDEVKGVMAAIHSGWKGTYDNIVLKTVERLKDEFNCNERTLKACILPHIKECCYQVSDELIEKFKDLDIFKNQEINKGRNLNLTKCVIIELLNSGLNPENILEEEKCTYCSREISLHSYRKDKENSGRNFSFIYCEN